MRETLRALGWSLMFALVAGTLLIGCAPGATQAQSPRPTATATLVGTPIVVASSPIAEQLGTQARQALGAQAQRIAVTYDASKQAATVNITITGKIPLTDAEIAAAHARVQVICYQVASAIWKGGTPMRELTLIVLGPMLNEYAEPFIDWYGVAVIGASSAQQIQWASLSPAAAWNLYDQHMLRTSFDVFD